MNNGESAATHIFAVLVENIGLFFLQTLGIHTLAFGGYPRYLIARCCAIGGILHLQLDLLLDGRFFLFHLLDLVGKLLPLIAFLEIRTVFSSAMQRFRIRYTSLTVLPLSNVRFWNTLDAIRSSFHSLMALIWQLIPKSRPCSCK